MFKKNQKIGRKNRKRKRRENCRTKKFKTRESDYHLSTSSKNSGSLSFEMVTDGFFTLKTFSILARMSPFQRATKPEISELAT